MTRRWKGEWPHPGGVAAAAGILLFGAHMHQRVQVAAKTPPARPEAQVASPMVARVPESVPGLLPDETVASKGLPDHTPTRVDPPAPAVSLPPAVPPSAKRPEARFGPPVPVRGPEWKGGTLPPFSPEVLRAMMDTRATRRARRLRRLGIVLPSEPVQGAPVAPRLSGQQLAQRPEPVQLPPGVPAGKEPAAVSSAGPNARADAALTDQKPAEKPAAEKGAGAAETKAGSSGDRTPTVPAAAPVANVATGPVRLQARLDRSRPEYRVGEWVALRFFSSQPAHLRVYRVDAAGHVTRLFSTYDRDESGHPARAFSMMVKAGEPQPGQERVVAIGSARPLSRDELLDCLRSYLAEGPAENSAPPPAVIADPKTTAAPSAGAPVPLAEALRAVIDAVGRAGDLPVGVAGLDRSAWSVAVGRFVSMPKGYRQSAVGDQNPAPPPLP